MMVYVDDAHGSGVLGKGHGTVKHFGLEKEVEFQIGTLSKAVGVVGGYVLWKPSVDRLVESPFASVSFFDCRHTSQMQLAKNCGFCVV